MKTGFHHTAFAVRDVAATNRFYEELMGFQLVHTELQRLGDGFVRHWFYDTGDGTYLGFFEIRDVGEDPGYKTEISTGLGLPVWVNHIAFKADAEQVQSVKRRMEAAGVPVLVEMNHGWCESYYFLDPNGIMVEFTVDTAPWKHDREEAYRMLFSTEANHSVVEIRNSDPVRTTDTDNALIREVSERAQ